MALARRAHTTLRTPPTTAALGTWLLTGALAVLVLLLAGLVHDFGRPSAARTWFSSRPELAGILLAVGFACMVGQRVLAGRRQDGYEGPRTWQPPGAV